MIELTRSSGQKIVITLADDEEIWIEIKDINTQSKNVIVGIKAPKNILINREEIHERNKAEARIPEDFCND